MPFRIRIRQRTCKSWKVNVSLDHPNKVLLGISRLTVPWLNTYTVQAFWPFVSRGNSAIVFLAGRQDVHDKSPTRRQFSFESHGYSPFLHHSKAGDAGDAARGRGLSYKTALHISPSGRGSRPNRFPWAYDVAWLMLIYSTRQSLGINEACHAISSQPLMRTVPPE